MTSKKEQFYIQRIAELEKQVAELTELVKKLTDKVAKLSKNSSNSSKPPRKKKGSGSGAGSLPSGQVVQHQIGVRKMFQDGGHVAACHVRSHRFDLSFGPL